MPLRSIIIRHNEAVAHDGTAVCAAIGLKSGLVLATGGDDCAVNVWRLGKPHVIASFRDFKKAVTCVAFSASEAYLAAGSESGAVKVWSMERGKVKLSLAAHRSAVRCVSFHPRVDHVLASGGMDARVQILDTASGTVINSYSYAANARMRGSTAPPAAITAVCFSPPGNWLAAGDASGRVILWDLSRGVQLHAWEGAGQGATRTNPVAAAAGAAPSAGSLASGTVAPGPGHRGAVLCLIFHPDELLLASGGEDRTVRIWDADPRGRGSPGSGGDAAGLMPRLAVTPADAGPIRSLLFLRPDTSSPAFALASVTDTRLRVWNLPGLDVGGGVEQGEQVDPTPITTDVLDVAWPGVCAVWAGANVKGQPSAQHLVAVSLRHSFMIASGVDVAKIHMRPEAAARAVSPRRPLLVESLSGMGSLAPPSGNQQHARPPHTPVVSVDIGSVGGEYRFDFDDSEVSKDNEEGEGKEEGGDESALYTSARWDSLQRPPTSFSPPSESRAGMDSDRHDHGPGILDESSFDSTVNRSGDGVGAVEPEVALGGIDTDMEGEPPLPDFLVPLQEEEEEFAPPSPHAPSVSVRRGAGVHAEALQAVLRQVALVAEGVQAQGGSVAKERERERKRVEERDRAAPLPSFPSEEELAAEFEGMDLNFDMGEDNKHSEAHLNPPAKSGPAALHKRPPAPSDLNASSVLSNGPGPLSIARASRLSGERAPGDFVPSIRDAPVGLAFEAFLPDATASGFGASRVAPLGTTQSLAARAGSAQAGSRGGVGGGGGARSSAADGVLSAVSAGRRAFMDVATRRRSELHACGRHWGAGNVRTALGGVSRVGEPGAVADVLCALAGITREEEERVSDQKDPFAQGRVRVQVTACATVGAGTGVLEGLMLNIEQAACVLALAYTALTDTSPTVQLVGVHAASAVFRTFAPVLRTLRLAHLGPVHTSSPLTIDAAALSRMGLDPTVEDRLKRAGVAVEELERVRARLAALMGVGTVPLAPAAKGLALAYDSWKAGLSA